ncbi:MAG: ATP-binding protein, partial [Moraxellaceae bacterium]
MAKTKEELLKDREDINAQIALLNPNSVSFSVDANIINRLGRELIGKAETGVSELIKNAYDADATLVKLNFIDSNITGGKLIIADNGHGMSRSDLVKGFMTLSSTTKI